MSQIVIGMTYIRSISTKKDVVNDPVEIDLRKAFAGYHGLLSIIFFTLTVQLAVSCGSYSGYGKPPMFGDFEAQRHWMEITVNLPIENWYINSTENDMNYWGLDYPPLTAYHSYVLGKISQIISPSWVSLHRSRGIQDPSHKFFMRMTVLLTILFPKQPVHHLQNHFAAVVLLYPGLISIDNGHFQYNHIALGLFLLAILLFSMDRLALGSLSFVLAVHFKQMELYHALPIAVYLFFSCFFSFRRRTDLIEGYFDFYFNGSLYRLLISQLYYKLLSFLKISPNFAPRIGRFLINSSALVTFIQYSQFSLHNIGPNISALLFLFNIDKVANLWCAVNVLIKLKQKYEISTLVRVRWSTFNSSVTCSSFVVLFSHIPSISAIACRPTFQNLKRGLLLSSLSFFLFSFQVHEKSILFVAIPALLLWPDQTPLMSWLLVVSNLTMYPLCIQDGNSLHLALFICYYILLLPSLCGVGRLKTIIINGSCLMGFLICFANLCIRPPKRFPHIFPLLTALYGFVHFLYFFLKLNLVLMKDTLNSLKSKICPFVFPVLYLKPIRRFDRALDQLPDGREAGPHGFVRTQASLLKDLTICFTQEPLVTEQQTAAGHGLLLVSTFLYPARMLPVT
ncbi:unnamed protein product [Enterobius vermicularis]|uniref:Alpha-1,3-glucosyltransferase n=1 Tax=Enterobius vermicularis TaxID=51028 RepID=A0A0N4V4F9_ENTVE|nr:unnamed protein product [Enterobius vermicularis]